MASLGITLEVDDAALGVIADEGFDPVYGARPLRRAVERYIEDELAEEILKGTFKKAQSVDVILDNSKIIFIPQK